ncbi:MAG: transposase [Candidatus Uhrbacteria bacterium]|nr:transposase [Patescibacteria group bacterium]MBU1907327.1 transposase [Patescibacteria group bacterium]
MAQSLRTHKHLAYENQIIFITTKTFNDHKLFTNGAFCLILQDELFFYSDQYNVELLAYVIMPNHLHCLIWPQGKKTFSDYVQGIKSHSAKIILEHFNRREPSLPPVHAAARAAAYEMKRIKDPGHKRNLRHKIWQPGMFPYLINRPTTLQRKLEYIMNNPVEAGLVKSPLDYPWLYVNSNIYRIA